MFGAVLGDILGQPYEGILFASEPFELMRSDCDFSDDTVLICAVADSIVNGRDIEDSLRGWWSAYPGRHYGGWFSYWAGDPDAPANESNGNGAAMRISPFALIETDSIALQSRVRDSAVVTHNTDEAVRGATALATATHSALRYGTKSAVLSAVRSHSYALRLCLEDYQNHQVFELRCDDTVPKAITAALAADCYEQAIRNAVLIGGDVDTIACMAGGIAEGLYGIPASLGHFGWSRIDDQIRESLQSLYTAAGRDGIQFDGFEIGDVLERQRLARQPMIKKILRGFIRGASNE